MYNIPIDTEEQNIPHADENLQKYEQLSKERKELQAKGHLPDWYTTPSWQMFKSKYAVKGEDAVRGRHERIAKTLARHMPHEQDVWERRFFNLLWEGVLSPASPALSNTGTNRGMPVSCSGQYIEDSIDSFYSNMRETAILSKHGFGTSADFSAIRPRGTKFGDNGKANGPVEVINDFFTTAAKVSQGGTRRGSIGAYLDIEHPDWDEACDQLAADNNGKNYGWTIRDSFVAKLKNNDAEANRRWEKALYTKLITGKGYIFCVDKANRHRPQMYKELGLDIKASNLCVAPETEIFTDQGYKVISHLEGQKVNVWNGKEFSEVEVVKTGTNQKLIKVITSSGFELECTPYHKFYVQKSYGTKSVETRAKDLKPGDKLIRLSTPAVEGSKELDLAYENGFYSGDGCTVQQSAGARVNHRVYLYGGKRKLADLFKNKTQHYVQENQDREYFNIVGLKDKFFVPDESYLIKDRLAWLAGWLDADGTVCKNGDSQTIQAVSVNRGFLNEVQKLLQMLGVQSKVNRVREAGAFMMPANDGSGNLKEYACQTTYRLLIGGMGTHDLVSLGLTTYRLDISPRLPQRNCEGFVKVVGVVDTGRIADTYCFNEPKRHMGVFNGLLTGQCSEIVLHSSAEYTFSCILSSLNLLHWDKIKNSDAVFVATVFLDCMCSEFIESSKRIPGLEKVRAFTEKGRAIGLGVMGFHTYLQTKGIPYISLEANFLSTEIAKHIHDESLRASQYLAKVLGEPDWCKGYGVRNTHRTAYAPTKTTALLMGGVSESWFPEPGAVFDAGTSVGEMRRITPVIYELMKKKGVYNEKTIQDIIDNLGSVQHVDWLTDDEKLVFLNAFEMDQRIILRHSVQRQKYTCQGQSLNFYVPEDGSEDLIAELMTKVLLEEDCLSQYYIYSRSGVVIKDECISCAG